MSSVKRIKSVSKHSWISLLCFILSIFIFYLFTIAWGKFHFSGDIYEIMYFFTRFFLIAGFVFAAYFTFSTGYRNEGLLYLFFMLPITAFAIVTSAISIITYEESVKPPFGFALLCIYCIFFFGATFFHNIGIVCRIKDDERKKKWASFCLVSALLCASLIPVALVITAMYLLAENPGAL